MLHYFGTRFWHGLKLLRRMNPHLVQQCTHLKFRNMHWKLYSTISKNDDSKIEAFVKVDIDVLGSMLPFENDLESSVLLMIFQELLLSLLLLHRQENIDLLRTK